MKEALAQKRKHKHKNKEIRYDYGRTGGPSLVDSTAIDALALDSDPKLFTFYNVRNSRCRDVRDAEMYETDEQARHVHERAAPLS